MASTQQSEGDCLSKDHFSSLPDRVHLDLKQNDFTDLLNIWDKWGATTRANFDRKYGHIARLLKVQKTGHRRKLAKMMGITSAEVDQNLRKKGDNECIPWSFLRGYIMKQRDTEQGQLVMALAIYGLVIFPKVLGHIKVGIIDFFEQVVNKANPSPFILAETLRSLNYCRRKGEGRFVGCAQLLSIWIMSHFECKVDKFRKPFHPQTAPIREFCESEWPENRTKEQWISRFRELMSVKVTWRAPWMPHHPFVPMTHRLNTLEFAYGEPGFLKRIEEIAQAWKKTSRVDQGRYTDEVTTGYQIWHDQRVKDVVYPKEDALRGPVDPEPRDTLLESELARKKSEAENASWKQRYEDLQKECEKMKREVSEQRNKVRKMEGKYESLNDKFSATTSELRREIQVRENQGNELQTHNDGLRRQVRFQQESIQLLRQEYEELEGVMTTYQQEYERLKQQSTRIQEWGSKIARPPKPSDQRVHNTRQRARIMGEEQRERMDRMERAQEEMREQLAKMMELMMSLSKGKRAIKEPAPSENPPAQDSGNQREDPPYPPGFTPPHAQTSQRVHPQVIPPVYYNAPPPLGHQPIQGQFGPYSGINPAEPINVPDLDDPKEQEKLRKDSSQTGENEKDQKKYDLLEERLRAIEGVDRFGTMDATELCLVPDVLIPAKFKVPEFEKYDGTKCPMAHITMYCRKMAAQSHDDKLLIHFFQDSLTGSAARWYVQLDRNRIKTWKDLARAFIAQYKHVAELAPDRLSLQTMEKKQSENFKEYAQRWRDTAAQVQPPLIDKEMTVLFINTLRAPFYERLIGNATKNFADLVLSGEIIEGAIKSGKIEGHEVASSKKGRMIRRVKKGIDEIQTPMDKVFEALSKINVITPEPIDTKELGHDLAYSCKFHMGAIGHSIQNCDGFRRKLQELMDSSVIEFYEGAEENLVGTINGDTPAEVASSSFGANKPKPLTIFYEENRSPMNDTSPTMIRNDLTGVGGITRSGRCYSPEVAERVGKGKPSQGEGGLKKADTFAKDQVDESIVAPNSEVKNPVTEKEAGEFLKFIKHSEYSVVEQLTKMPARISLLSLLLNSEAHRNALLKVLNQAYVAQDISVEKLDHIVGNITVGNFIAFNDEEIPSGGRGGNKALHITIKCKDHAVPRVLVDNGSALNVMPRSTLTKLPVDVSYMRTSRMVVRAFDGTTREVVGDIELPIKIGPCIFEVQFQVMDIAPSYNCLLGRPWIHMAGAIPSSLHQKVKFIAEGQLISVCAEEDILAIQPSSAPYVEATEVVPECSFRSFEFVNATYVGEKKVIPTPRLSLATKMGVKQTVGKGCRAGLGLGKNLQGINRPLTPMKNEERFGLGYKPTKEERRKLTAQKKIKRMAQLEGKEEEFGERTIPRLYETFRSAGFIHLEAPPKVNQVLRIFDELSIHMIRDEEPDGKIPMVYPVLPGEELSNWTATELPIIFKSSKM
ncbi:Gag-pro-like protein [Theobroma cacao]|uniref:Gag-pro-like protein n=1 Tax=Theobroma cacao TaxID=3641 RepID=A0A061E733_THECC|nr:Gag-pro-like protein [Theobroma cacao]